MLHRLHYLVFFAFSISTPASPDEIHSEPLRICTSDIVADEFPELNAILINAIKETGIEFSTQTYPNLRSRMNLNTGNCHLVTAANSDTFAADAPIIRLEPNVLDLSFWLVVLAERSTLCDLPKEDLKNSSIVGLKGVRVYKHFIYPFFGETQEASNLKQLSAMLEHKRADFSALPRKLIEQISGSQKHGFLTCNQSPLIRLQFHSFLHESVSWAKPQIEAAYREAFDQIVKAGRSETQ